MTLYGIEETTDSRHPERGGGRAMSHYPHKRVGARARAQITIEVDSGSNWGNETQVAQVFDQAGRETADKIEQALQKEFSGVTFIGTPRVIAVLAEEKDR